MSFKRKGFMSATTHYGNPKLNKRQRDALVLKAESLRSIAQSRELSLAPFGRDPMAERFYKVARRLSHFVAGVKSSAEMNDKRNATIDAYMAGEISAHHCAERFRWLGMNSRLADAMVSEVTKKRNAEQRDRPDALQRPAIGG